MGGMNTHLWYSGEKCYPHGLRQVTSLRKRLSDSQGHKINAVGQAENMHHANQGCRLLASFQPAQPPSPRSWAELRSASGETPPHLLSASPASQSPFLGWTENCLGWNEKSLRFLKCLDGEPCLLCPGTESSTAWEHWETALACFCF